jgi:hypothetical protein
LPRRGTSSELKQLPAPIDPEERAVGATGFARTLDDRPRDPEFDSSQSVAGTPQDLAKGRKVQLPLTHQVIRQMTFAGIELHQAVGA